MKANYLDMNRRKRQAKQMVDKMIDEENQRRCEKCLAELNRQCVTTSKFNAMIHVMHMLVVLHDRYGFGKQRLEELLSEYSRRDGAFREDLADGVAWTKVRRRLEEIGLEFAEDDMAECHRVERLFEKGVRYSEEFKPNFKR